MKREKNIDDIIRGKLDGFSVSPPPVIWENVLDKLAAQRRKTRRMYIGWISAAAVVVLAFLAGWYFNDNSTPHDNAKAANEIIQPEKNGAKTDIESTEIASGKTVEIPENKSDKQINTEISGLIAQQPVSAKTKSKKTNASEENTISREIILLSKIESSTVRVAQSQTPNSELAIKTKSTNANYLTERENLLIAENIRNIKSMSKPENNWKMGMYVSPGYSSYSASHSESYSKDMNYSDNNGNSNVSGGISVQYKTSKRWIVESGVYYAKNGQESDKSLRLFAQNMDEFYAPASGENSYFSNAVRLENNTLEMNSTAGVIAFSDTPDGAEISSEFEGLKSDVGNLTVPNGSFSQVFQFMEIPLFVRYRVVDSKLGVELITGLNAGIVVGNDAYIDNQYGLQKIGETQDISTVNVSGTVGVGLNYALSKHFSVALEPRFNYYLNSINTSSLVDFRPYRLGLYTGVSYEF
ncbi:MAG TPA: outer membrane beta-barrel protein [Draconibacterium sp.]|nr:outer membrane beta-barrel protein [Draconibacterium sp.]